MDCRKRNETVNKTTTIITVDSSPPNLSSTVIPLGRMNHKRNPTMAGGINTNVKYCIQAKSALPQSVVQK